MNIKWEWMVEYRKCFGCQTTKIPPWMCDVRACFVCVFAREREKEEYVCVWVKFMVLASVYCSTRPSYVSDDWLPNVNEKMCFNCVIRRLHIRFRKFNCFYFGVSPFDSIILISNLYLDFFSSFFRSLIIMCSNRSTFIYCLLKIYMSQTPNRENSNETKSTTRWTRCCVRPNRKIRLLYCLNQAQLKHRSGGIHTRVRWVSFDYSRKFLFRHSIESTILSCTRHTTL